MDINKLGHIARKAGDEILRVYNDETLSKSVDYKADNSPLTLADKASNEVIVRELKKIYPEMPILSEEEKHTEYQIRKSWDTFWLVDPLDGTKEFIKRNGEFTVNIALIEKGFPVIGIIYAPVLDRLFVGDVASQRSTVTSKSGEEVQLEVNGKKSDRIAVGSRSHSSEEETSLLKSYDVIETISIGSSLKFCMVAEGRADIYYRHGPTMEWDTAAGQAIVEAAGGSVTHIKSNSRFTYNRENLLNGSFLVKGF